MSQPQKPAAEKPAKSGIQVESNDAVEVPNAQKIESVVEDHPAGIQVETFTGVQPNINWVDATAAQAASE